MFLCATRFFFHRREIVERIERILRTVDARIHVHVCTGVYAHVRTFARTDVPRRHRSTLPERPVLHPRTLVYPARPSVRFVPGCRDQNPYHHPFRRATSTDFSPLFSFFEVRPPIKLYLSPSPPSSLLYHSLLLTVFLFFFFFPSSISSVANRIRIHLERERERENEDTKRTIPASISSISRSMGKVGGRGKPN